MAHQFTCTLAPNHLPNFYIYLVVMLLFIFLKITQLSWTITPPQYFPGLCCHSTNLPISSSHLDQYLLLARISCGFFTRRSFTVHSSWQLYIDQSIVDSLFTHMLMLIGPEIPCIIDQSLVWLSCLLEALSVRRLNSKMLFPKVLLNLNSLLLWMSATWFYTFVLCFRSLRCHRKMLPFSLKIITVPLWWQMQVNPLVALIIWILNTLSYSVGLKGIWFSLWSYPHTTMVLIFSPSL